MRVKSLKKETSRTNEGYPIPQRNTYVYEFCSSAEAKNGEIKFQIGVRHKNPTAQLYAKGVYLYLDVPGSDDDLAKLLYQKLQEV